MLPYKLLYRDVKDCTQSTQDQKYIQTRLGNATFMTYDSFKRIHKYERNLTDAELKSLNELANSPDILISKADKCNTVVIFDKKLCGQDERPTV